MLPEDQEESNLEKSAPGLFNKEKVNPFSVPENYFEALPGQITNKILASTPVPWYEKFLKTWLSPGLALATITIAIMVSMGVFYFIRQHQEIPQKEMVIINDDYGNADVLGEVDESALIEELTAYNDESLLQSPSDADIENYLIENQTDINQIINEL